MIPYAVAIWLGYRPTFEDLSPLWYALLFALSVLLDRRHAAADRQTSERLASIEGQERVREDLARAEERLRVVERELADLKSVPGSIIRLDERVHTVEERVGELRGYALHDRILDLEKRAGFFEPDGPTRPSQEQLPRLLDLLCGMCEGAMDRPEGYTDCTQLADILGVTLLIAPDRSAIAPDTKTFPIDHENAYAPKSLEGWVPCKGN